MRDDGRASKAAILGVIKDIDDYVTIVQNELNAIKSDAASMSSMWKDQKFSQFLQCVDALKASMERDLAEMVDARQQLIKKVGLM